MNSAHAKNSRVTIFLKYAPHVIKIITEDIPGGKTSNWDNKWTFRASPKTFEITTCEMAHQNFKSYSLLTKLNGI